MFFAANLARNPGLAGCQGGPIADGVRSYARAYLGGRGLH